MSGARPIGAVDAIWLDMDRPTNVMAIDALMLFDEQVDLERLRGVAQQRLVERFPVFSQHPVPPSALRRSWHWVEDEDFSLDRHVRVVRLPKPGGEAELQRHVESQMSVMFDREHALWEMQLIRGYSGGSAVLTRFHHAMADGLALAQVLLSMTDDEPGADAVLPAFAPARRGRRSLAPLLPLAVDAVNAAPGLFRPSNARHAVTAARQTAGIVDKLLLGSNPATPLTGTPGVAKRAAWSTPQPIAELKLAGRAAGATLNDVLMTAVSAAIASYVADHGGEPVDLTTMVPVNMRPTTKPLPAELGNQFTLVLLRLPTGAWAPLQRLVETKQRMDAIKHSPESMLTSTLMNAIGRQQPAVAKALVTFFAGKSFGVTTNVAGPLKRRYFAGTPLTGVFGWVPGSGSQTLGVCIFTYDGMVRVGFKADAGVIPDPDKLVAAFDEELQVLRRVAHAV